MHIASTATTERNTRGISDVYPPIGHAVAVAVTAAAASSAAFLSASAFSAAARPVTVDMVMMEVVRT